MKLFVMALLALIAAPLQAQTVSVSSTVTWTPPTTDSNGVPLNSAGDPNVITGYKIYASGVALTAAPATASATAAASATSATFTFPAAAGSTVYYYVTACDSTGCSPLSAAATKVAAIPGTIPNSPTAVTVSVTTTTVTTSTTTTASPAK